jgi:hypothetical protein
MQLTKLTSVRVELRLVQVLEDILDGLDSPIPSDRLASLVCLRGTHCLGRNVHLKVTSDEELTAHLGGLCMLETLSAKIA